MPLIFAIVVVALIAGAALWVASSGWMIRTGLEDLARRRRLLRGTDPLQLTAEQAVDSARRSHLLALETLTATVDSWYDLQRTLGIGTPLEAHYGEVKRKADADVEFARLLDRATSACLEGSARPPDSVADLVSETARLDSLTLGIRSYIHRARPPRRRGLGGLLT